MKARRRARGWQNAEGFQSGYQAELESTGMRSAVSLFTGCGGSDLGLRAAGFALLMANDVSRHAKAVYQHNLPETDYRLCSIAKIKNFPPADLLAGCYPCQGFSQGGARKADNPVNRLYLEFARALAEISPKAFIVENVPGMLNSNFRYLLDAQVKAFEQSGKEYKVKWGLLDARGYGVPQERKRIFIVGIRMDIDAEYEFPPPRFSDLDTSLPPCKKIKEALFGLPEWPPESEYNTQEFHWYYLSRNRWRGWDECSKTILANSRHMPLHPVSPCLVKAGDDKWEFETKGKARRFSYKEAIRIQGFPHEFSFPEGIGLASRYRLAGNAVPPPLFESVAKALPDIW